METTVEPYTMELPDGENGVNWTEYKLGNHITHRIVKDCYLSAKRHNDGTCSLFFTERGKIGEVEIVLTNADTLILLDKINMEFEVAACPFCEGIGKLSCDGGGATITCEGCGVCITSNSDYPVESVIEMWNRRANNED